MLRRLPLLSLRLSQCASFKTRRAQARPAGVHVVHQVTVHHHQPRKPGEIVAVPVIIDVGLARAHGSRENHVRVEARIAHANGHIERHRIGNAAEGFVMAGIDQAQAPEANLAQLDEQHMPGEPGQGGYRLLRESRGVGGNDVLFHEILGGVARGWSKTGVRFTHSLSACQ